MGRQGISRAVFFMYPHVFVVGPNKHDALFLIAYANGTRNATVTCHEDGELAGALQSKVVGQKDDSLSPLRCPFQSVNGAEVVSRSNHLHITHRT